METAASHLPVSIHAIRHLVFQGGGVKGIAHVGAYQALLRAGLSVDQIENVAGTSAGAINAMLLSVGYTPEEMLSLLKTLNFKTFLDQDKVDIRSAVLEMKEKKGVGLFAKSISHSSTLSRASSILNKAFGLFEGEVLRLWAEDLIQKKTEVEHLTFAELHQLRLKNPQKYKDLYVMGANANTHQSTIFSWQQTPHVIISDAVRISMSIPIIFMPHQVFIKKMGFRQLDEKQESQLYIDGGVTDNYPLFLFDEYQYLPVDSKAVLTPGTRCANPSTLGFMLVEKTKHDYLTQVTKEAPHEELVKFLPYVKAVLGTIYNKQDSDHVLAKDSWRTIYIDNCGVNTMDFDLDESQNQALIESAQRSVEEFYLQVQNSLRP